MSLTFLHGHPVPYSLTVQRNGRSIGARRHIEAVRDYLRQAAPEAIITKVEGAYVFYDLKVPQSEATHRPDENGVLRQTVTPETLRAILDADGDTHDRPADFSPDDEWNVAEVPHD